MNSRFRDKYCYTYFKPRGSICQPPYTDLAPLHLHFFLDRHIGVLRSGPEQSMPSDFISPSDLAQ